MTFQIKSNVVDIIPVGINFAILIARVSTGQTKSLKEWSDQAEMFRIGFFGPDNPKKLFSDFLVEKNFVENFVKREKFEISGF